MVRLITPVQNIQVAPSFSVVVPMFNVAADVIPSLTWMMHCLRRNGARFELIAVDDCSTDETLKQLVKLEAGFPELKIVPSVPHRGTGAAIRSGVEHAGYDFVLITELGSDIPIHHIEELLPIVENGADFASVERVEEGKSKSFIRKAAIWCKKLMARTKTKDPSCGFRLFKTSAAKSIYSHCRISGEGTHEEALKIARTLGLEGGVAQVSCRRYHDAGSSAASEVLGAAKLSAKIFINHLVGAYGSLAEERGRLHPKGGWKQNTAGNSN
ncbi:MAG: glycosyltransferase family 2 protein [Planctomycetes bacterium]|nr:glycosyltransferase family 2 protein [Planctomycetota bacterium]